MCNFGFVNATVPLCGERGGSLWIALGSLAARGGSIGVKIKDLKLFSLQLQIDLNASYGKPPAREGETSDARGCWSRRSLLPPPAASAGVKRCLWQKEACALISTANYGRSDQTGLSACDAGRASGVDEWEDS